MIPSRKTPQSMSNEHRIQEAIKKYDEHLNLRFSGKQGYYYVARRMKRSSWSDMDPADKEMLYARGSEYAEALANHELVVCTPIEVWMMESYEVAHRNIMRHLKNNDMYQMGTNSEERVRNVETENDNHWDDFELRQRQSGYDDLRAYGREFFRDHVQPKSSLAGVKINGRI